MDSGDYNSLESGVKTVIVIYDLNWSRERAGFLIIFLIF